METGFRGTFVISWSQTDIDGLEAAPLESLETGAAWAWRGDPVRVDGPNELLRLDGANGEADLRKRAASKVRRLVGAAVQNRQDVDAIEVEDPLLESSFVVTNGSKSFTITLIEVGRDQPPLLMFMDQMPPRNTDLWVVHQSLGATLKDRQAQDGGGVICFTPGTFIATPDGSRRVEDLTEGDWIQTRDNGAQQVMWIGQRRMTGARLFAMPHLRPIRIRAGALGIDRPEQELLVSPEHKMLVRGHAARALFNEPEVLVPARDLVNDRTILRDMVQREVTYIHLLLENHQIIWANNVETESFHPASAALSALSDDDRARLLNRLPDIAQDPFTYGGFVRRSLSASEAAILMHEVA